MTIFFNCVGFLLFRQCSFLSNLRDKVVIVVVDNDYFYKFFFFYLLWYSYAEGGVAVWGRCNQFVILKVVK